VSKIDIKGKLIFANQRRSVADIHKRLPETGKPMVLTEYTFGVLLAELTALGVAVVVLVRS